MRGGLNVQLGYQTASIMIQLSGCSSGGELYSTHAPNFKPY